MRFPLLIATAFAVLVSGADTAGQQIGPIPGAPGAPGGGSIAAPGAVTAAQAEKQDLVLDSGLFAPLGLPLAESAKGVYRVHLAAERDKKGDYRGTLVLDCNAPTFDEFGFTTLVGDLPRVKLECTLMLVKKRTFRMSGPRLGSPEHEDEWLLFEIKGPKIASRLFLAMTGGSLGYYHGHLLVHGKDGKVQYSVDVETPLPPEPCHPGCFPAGTAIDVSGGTKPIERIREGDLVTTVGPDGSRSQGKVASVFVTRNRLVEVRTAAGSLITTETQPFSLAGGELRAAGQLNAGDRIYRWNGGQRRAVAVLAVSATGREESVFNLILGDPAIFVANGFLVRSKPPAPLTPGQTEGGAP